jgi:hypothetical protein
MQIFMAWPKALGLTPWFDRDWLTDDHAALVALFGPTARAPRSDFEMAGFLGSRGRRRPAPASDRRGLRPAHRHAEEPALRRCRNRVPRGGRRKLPRRAAGLHPAVAYVEAMYGRGPLWRAAGRVIDLAVILEGRSPAPSTAPEGWAIVPATRGYYAVSVGTRTAM